MSATLKNTYAPAPAVVRGKATHLGGDIAKKERITYCTGKAVVVRNLNNPLDAYLFYGHPAETTVARLSPSGFYIASADVQGRVLIWDTVNEEHITTLEKLSLGGAIVDLQWTEDSKRIITGGDGREKYGDAFFADSGASVGEISGHSKPITTVDVKQTRPYRAATGSEDFKVNFFQGPPFKYDKSNSEHTRFVNCVRFSPDGTYLVSAGSDKKLIVYDGKTGEQLKVLEGHNGGIYAVSWSADSKHLLTASGDKTAAIFNVEAGEMLTKFELGKEVTDQQLGCLWQGDHLVTLSLAGDLIMLDQANPDKPAKVISGHNKTITALVYDKESKQFVSADFEGKALVWNLEDGSTRKFDGVGHRNQISAMVMSGRNIVSASMDDTVKITPMDTLEWGQTVSLGSQATDVDATDSIIVATGLESVVVVQGGNVTHRLETNYRTHAVAIRPDGTQVAVGGADNKIHLFKLQDGKLTEDGVIELHRGAVVSLKYSPNGVYLASGDTNREVRVTKDKEAVVSGWVFHTARVDAIAWSEDNDHLATGSLDSNVLVWSVSEPSKRVLIKGAHHGGVKAVDWVDANTVLTTGQDCAVKSWTLTF